MNTQYLVILATILILLVLLCWTPTRDDFFNVSDYRDTTRCLDEKNPGSIAYMLSQTKKNVDNLNKEIENEKAKGQQSNNKKDQLTCTKNKSDFIKCIENKDRLCVGGKYEVAGTGDKCKFDVDYNSLTSLADLQKVIKAEVANKFKNDATKLKAENDNIDKIFQTCKTDIEGCDNNSFGYMSPLVLQNLLKEKARQSKKLQQHIECKKCCDKPDKQSQNACFQQCQPNIQLTPQQRAAQKAAAQKIVEERKAAQERINKQTNANTIKESERELAQRVEEQKKRRAASNSKTAIEQQRIRLLLESGKELKSSDVIGYSTDNEHSSSQIQGGLLTPDMKKQVQEYINKSEQSRLTMPDILGYDFSPVEYDTAIRNRPGQPSTNLSYTSIQEADTGMVKLDQNKFYDNIANIPSHIMAGNMAGNMGGNMGQFQQGSGTSSAPPIIYQDKISGVSNVFAPYILVQNPVNPTLDMGGFQ